MEKDRCGLMSHRGRRGLNNNNQRASTQMSSGTPLDDNNNDNGTVYFIVGRMGAPTGKMKTGHTQPPPKISKGISSVTFASAPAALSLHNVAIQMNQQIISLIYACHR